MLIKTWRLITSVLVALLMGLGFAHVLERPAKMLYDAAFCLTLQKTLYVSWGPPNIGEILEPAAILSMFTLAFILRNKKRELWLVLSAGIVLLAEFSFVFSPL